ncbi:AAA family ATPase [Pectobacterium polaris]|uniref:AAA family ATPase n=1 Tax=Pectobacterium polaris TaxID=2042057 RepID=UPI001CC4A6B6|nr:AAA family ATPase [Pectobacterium polaris]UAY91570.1 AAA family ATPase [Pectobacterium polaris]
MAKIIYFEATGVWEGERKEVRLNDKINFLVGTNGSGKTTILRIIHAMSMVDIQEISNLPFNNAFISLDDTTKIAVSKDRGTIEFSVSDMKNNFSYYFDMEDHDFINGKKTESIKEIIAKNLSVKFLSINRKDSFDAYDYNQFNERKEQAPVDIKLDEISARIVSEFSKMSQRFNSIATRFQKNIFFKMLDIPSESEISIYKDEVDISSEKMAISEIMSFFINKSSKSDSMSKVDKYYSRLSESIQKMQREIKKPEDNPDISDFSIVFNAWRTKSLIGDYEQLKASKKKIFHRQEVFLDVINSFFPQNKRIVFSKDNQLEIQIDNKNHSLDILSSGEKQMIILLGECFLIDNSEAIYIADEPELSLHVKWQDKIVDALVSLNPNAQYIFATHSPDIVGRRKESLIRIR